MKSSTSNVFAPECSVLIFFGPVRVELILWLSQLIKTRHNGECFCMKHLPSVCQGLCNQENDIDPSDLLIELPIEVCQLKSSPREMNDNAYTFHHQG